MEEQGPRLFEREPGKPIGFFLHPSIRDQSQRQTLTKNIESHGGKVLDDAYDADTVLINEKRLTNTRVELQTSYSIDRDKRLRDIVVEPMSFVQTCIRCREYAHRVPKRYPMGGYSGRKRVNFTGEDDDNLCWYLSRTIPDPNDGGRLSTGVYKLLVAMAEQRQEHKWAKRHTVESWRERYRKNRERLDPIIEDYATRYPPEPPALYSLSRRFNKHPRWARKSVEDADDDIIEIADSSGHESGEEYDLGVEPTRRGSSLGKGAKPKKRRRIENEDGSDLALSTPGQPIRTHAPSSGHTRASTSARKGKNKSAEVDQGTEEPRYKSPFAHDFLAPGPSHVQYGPHPQERQDDLQHTPPPTATLVHRSSPMLPPPPPTPPSNMYVRQTVPPSFDPSTSFRNVAHSSPLFTGSGSAHRSGARSHNTSATEPSSHSMIIPLGLVPPENNNGQAESSITRESSHKRSSPIPLPMKKAVRKIPSRRLPVAAALEDDEPAWAPYRNTRSRSRSVEPAPLQAPKRRRRNNHRLGNEAALYPVHEGEVEHEAERERTRGDNTNALEHVDERKENTVTPAPLTETMQDEQSVADFLMVDPNDTSKVSGTSDKKEDEGRIEGTEDEGEGERTAVGKKEEEEGEEKSGDEGSTMRADSTEPMRGEVEAGAEGDEASQEEGPDGSEEDGDGVRRKLSSSPRRSVHSKPRRPALESDDAETDRMIRSLNHSPNDTPSKSAQEVLALYGSSPDQWLTLQSLPRHRRPFNVYRTGSPSPLRARNQNRLHQPLPAPGLVIRARAFARKTVQTTLQTSPPLPSRPGTAQKSKPRVSFGLPSGKGSLPSTPVPLDAQRPRSQPFSRSQETRRGSVESSSSEMTSFPISGTRASAVKQQMEQELKVSPYTPPRGTKAAKVVAASGRQRPQRR